MLLFIYLEVLGERVQAERATSSAHKMRRLLLAVLVSAGGWCAWGHSSTSPILHRTRSVHNRQRQQQPHSYHPLKARSSPSSSSSTSSALRIRGGAVSSFASVDASTGLKLGLMAGLTALHCACWLIPLHMKSFTENEAVMSIANSFSGGVFLSLAFGHLLPEAVHDFTRSGGSEVVPCAVTPKRATGLVGFWEPRLQTAPQEPRAVDVYRYIVLLLLSSVLASVSVQSAPVAVYGHA